MVPVPALALDRVRVCSITPVLPTPRSAHAGGVFVWRLDEALSSFADVHYLVPELESNLPTMAQKDPRTFTRLVVHGGVLRHCLTRMFNVVKRLDGQAPFFAVLPSLLSPRAMKAIREADVLDFQWSDWAHWAVLRAINRRARVIVTLHDVTSQSARRRREQAERPLQRVKWGVSELLAACLQDFVLRVADRVVVLSEKDRALLGGGTRSDKVEVLDPPLGTNRSDGVFFAANHRVLFLAYFLRHENVEALEWFVEHVWPAVTSEVPNAQLRVVGTGLSADHRERLLRDETVRVEGYVEDIEEAYKDVHVAVVPLRSGAGVKFKSIDPLLRGLPTVTTSVGAEGIGGVDIFTAVEDEPQRFAVALRTALLQPADAVAKAERTRAWAGDRYGMPEFKRRVASIYGVHPGRNGVGQTPAAPGSPGGCV